MTIIIMIVMSDSDDDNQIGWLSIIKLYNNVYYIILLVYLVVLDFMWLDVVICPNV